MAFNRGMPDAEVIPELAYGDVREAAAWLCAAFGFRERLRIGGHRVQLLVGRAGAMVAVEASDGTKGGHTHAMIVRVDDVDAHHARAAALGAKILRAPADYAYGERQYTAEDLGGHVWTFSQSMADVDPASWGGVLVAP